LAEDFSGSHFKGKRNDHWLKKYNRQPYAHSCTAGGEHRTNIDIYVYVTEVFVCSNPANVYDAFCMNKFARVQICNFEFLVPRSVQFDEGQIQKMETGNSENWVSRRLPPRQLCLTFTDPLVFPLQVYRFNPNSEVVNTGREWHF